VSVVLPLLEGAAAVFGTCGTWVFCLSGSVGWGLGKFGRWEGGSWGLGGEVMTGNERGKGERGLGCVAGWLRADVCVVHAASMCDADGGTAGKDDLGEGGVFDVGG